MSQIHDPYQLNQLLFEVDLQEPEKLITLEDKKNEESTYEFKNHLLENYAFLLNPYAVN